MKTKSQMKVQVSKPDFTVPTEYNQQGMRSKSIKSNEQNAYVAKQPVTVSSQQGIRPNLITITDKKTHI